MKESKINESIENDKNIDEFDKKFEEDLVEIKQKLNAEKLSDEFKEKLQVKLEEELNQNNLPKENKVIDFPVISRKLAGICACFVLLFTSCFAFADEIENAMLTILGNTDRILEKAIENGNYKEIDMEYVENNGVSIKVDYVVTEDDFMYIAFNVCGKKDFDNLFFNNVIIKNNDEIIYKNNQENDYLNRNCKIYINTIKKNNIILIYQIFAKDVKSNDKINILIEDLQIASENELNLIDGIWEYDI